MRGIVRAIVIAGTHSGCGKTTVTLGILAALKKKGLRSQSFKAGPDFIDSGLHKLVTGRASRNLDLWMCGETYVADCFSKNSADVDVAVVEGVMGLYDGALSTASLAATLDLPVVLVVDAYGMAETAGALVRGFVESAAEKKLKLAGLIFNRVASKNHYSRLCADIRDIKVLGYLPRDLHFEIPHRHLGLFVAEENPILKENIDKLADAVLECIDVDMLLEMSAEHEVEEKVRRKGHPTSAGAGASDGHLAVTDSPVVAVAYDKAFSFYYEDNLELLNNAGAEIRFFSPLTDPAIPRGAGALYIGGGYPELYAKGLSENISLRTSIKNWAASGKPLYAECGGLMYLSRGIYDFEGAFFAMAGVLPFETRMTNGRSRLGYRQVSLKEDCVIGNKGDVLRGHEFHYSEIIARGEHDPTVSEIYSVKNGSRQALPGEGYRYKRTVASYIHIHFGSNPAIAREFVNQARKDTRR
jgi:cobyrinic acid a,c-diamide synthase